MSIFDFKTLMSKIKAHLSSILDFFKTSQTNLEMFLTNLSYSLKSGTQSSKFPIFNLN